MEYENSSIFSARFNKEQYPNTNDTRMMDHSCGITGQFKRIKKDMYWSVRRHSRD